MAKDVIITPASGKVDFYGTSGGSVLANINLTDNNDLSLSTTSGNLIIGDASRDVYIGDGTNEVDIVFEQNGEIRSVANKYIKVSAGQVNATGIAVNTSSPNAVVHVYGSTPSGTVLNVEGTNGSLFSVVDNLSGTLMSVNNNAGLPVLEVFSDDSLVAGRFGANDFVISSGGNVGIGTSTPSSKLHVVGSGLVTGSFTLSGQTASTIASFDTNKNLVSLSTTSYPSLTQISYVKGVTSAIQTQLDAKIECSEAVTTAGNIPTWNDTTGVVLNDGYAVSTNLTTTNGDGYIPRADAVKTYVDNLLAANDAMVFKGTLGTGGTVTALPTGTVSAGWTYRVITAGTYAGVVCEVGDLIIAVADASGSSNSTWTVVQTNIDGAVIGPASATSGNFPVFANNTGKLIANSTYGPSSFAAASHNQAESTITFTDITTGNATTSQHGYLPKLGGGTTNFLRADGSWATPPDTTYSGSTSIVLSSSSFQRAALTGDVTAAQNNNATTISNDVVTNAKLANMAVNTIKGRITAGTGDPEDLTAANVRTILSITNVENTALSTYSRAGIDSRTSFPASPHAITTHNANSWKMFFSNATAMQELSFGNSGTYLRSNGASANPTWSTVQYNELGGTIPTWNQNTTGSAATLTTERTLTIGSTGKTFNGGGDVSWSLAEINAFKVDESIVNIAAPNSSSGTWISADTDDWGTPRIGNIVARYNDAPGFLQFNIPAGMDTCYISQLQWSSGGYVNVHGVQSDGGLVFLRRINTRQSVENNNEGAGTGNTNQHDGSTITLAGTGLSSFVAIRFTNVLGRFHLTGMSFTSTRLVGAEGTGMVHPAQITYLGSSSQYIRGDGALVTFPTIPTVNDATLTMNVSGVGLSGSQTFTANQNSNATFTVTSNATSANTCSTIVSRDANGNFSAGTITANQVNVDNLRLDGNTLSVTNCNGSLVIAPNGTGALIAGSTGNSRGVHSVDLQTPRTACTQVASGSYSVIGGGFSNTASGWVSTVNGGFSNTASGCYSMVGGGRANTASGCSSAVGGGNSNIACAINSSISGGRQNFVNARHGSINGGHRNVIQSPTNECCSRGATIGGGVGHNTIGGTVCITTGDISGAITCCNAGRFSTISGGFRNIATGACSTVGGGFANTASGYYSTISGGYCNISQNYSTVGGGNFNDASGYNSTVGGGNSNTASGYYSTVSGGYGNTAGETGATVGGGTCNSACGSCSTVSGGFSNSACGICSTVSGGSNNTASEISATVGGGFSNTASACYSTVGGGSNNSACACYATTGGGSINSACGNYSTIGGGGDVPSRGSIGNTASGYFSSIIGGRSQCATGSYSSIIGGYFTKTSKYGEISHASGRFAQIGDAQHSIFVARNETTNTTPTELFLDGSAASQRMILPPETTWTFSIKLSSYNDTDNTSAWWIIRGGIRRNANNSPTLIGSLIEERDSEGDMSGTSVAVTADDTYESLKISVTGLVSKNIRWVAVVDVSQVSWATP